MRVKITSTDTKEIVLSDKNKAFPAVSLAAGVVDKLVDVSAAQLDALIPVLDRYAATVSYEVVDDPASSDAREGALKRTVTVTHAELTAAALSQAINIGAALPAKARVLGFDLHALTPFSGGGATAVSVEIGTAGDVDAIVDGANLFAAAVDGGPSTMPLGVRPHKAFLTGGQLIATFTSDVNVVNLAAGSVIVDVWYAVG